MVLGESPREDRKVKRSIPTIAELFADTYLPHLALTRRNMDSDLSFWKIHLLPRFGPKRLDELTRDDVIHAQQSMFRAGYAKGTANKWVVQIRYMYNVAKELGIPGTESNPGADIKQFAVEGRERYLSVEEAERLRVAVETSLNTQLKYIVALLLLLGCRKSELLEAKWEHFDLERRSWRIPLSKSGKARFVPLSEAAVSVLEQIPRCQDCPYVVPNPATKKPYSSVFVPWDKARKKAGLPDVRLHDLRHTFASNLVNAGQSLYVVSKALGHATTQMTERYAHIADDTLLAAANAAANVMGSSWTAMKKVPAELKSR